MDEASLPEPAVAQPQPKAAPYALPRGRRKRRANADVEPEETAPLDVIPLAPAKPDKIAAARARQAHGSGPTPAEMLRLVSGVRWERESQEEYLAQSALSIAQPAATLGRGIYVYGRVECEGHIELQGVVDGEIFCESIAIAPWAKVYGSIVAKQVWVAGTIEGPITAHSVTLAKTARVNGSIFHRELHMEPGAQHNGRKPWRLNPLENR